MTTRSDVLRLLADGDFHSGTDMGRALGLTRAAVCKAIKSLADAGLDVHRVTGRGYRLPLPVRPLERRAILRLLGPDAEEVRDRLTLIEETDSTNRYLLEHANAAKFPQSVCLAEAQAAGRGRRGRHWVATPYHNLLLSMAWRFGAGPGIVSGLSLAAGVALMRALEEHGVTGGRSRHPAGGACLPGGGSRDTGTSLCGAGLGLKWPNDVLWEGKKLAGLLVDVQGEASGPSLVVLGVGINGYIGDRDAAQIDQPWTDLFTITGELIDRNRLAALVIRHLRRMFGLFARQGLAAFRDAWQDYHLYHGRPVRLLAGNREIRGKVEGIDAHGALLLRDSRGALQTYHSGEISLRPSA